MMLHKLGTPGKLIALTIAALVGALVFGVILLTLSPKSTATLSKFASPTVMMERGFGGGMAMMQESMAFDAAAPEMAMIAPAPFPGTAGVTAAEVDQKVIKTGSLSVVVDDVRESVSKMTAIATGKGGFVRHSSVSEREDGTHFGNITVRVPSSEFEAALAELKDDVNVVENESVSGQDVTEQFTDLEARLRNAKAQESTYLRILDQAVSVEDILNVQRELGNIRAQIESLEGRIQYLENQTSFSTISIRLSEEPTVALPTKEFRPGTAIQEAGRALVQIAQQLVISLIWLAIVGGGILIPILILVWLGKKLMHARRGGKKR